MKNLLQAPLQDVRRRWLSRPKWPVELGQALLNAANEGIAPRRVGLAHRLASDGDQCRKFFVSAFKPGNTPCQFVDIRCLFGEVHGRTFRVRTWLGNHILAPEGRAPFAMTPTQAANLSDIELRARIHALQLELRPLLAESELRARSAGQKLAWSREDVRDRRLVGLRMARECPETAARAAAARERTLAAKADQDDQPKRIRAKASAGVLASVARYPLEAALFGGRSPTGRSE